MARTLWMCRGASAPPPRRRRARERLSLGYSLLAELSVIAGPAGSASFAAVSTVPPGRRAGARGENKLCRFGVSVRPRTLAAACSVQRSAETSRGRPAPRGECAARSCTMRAARVKSPTRHTRCSRRGAEIPDPMGSIVPVDTQCRRPHPEPSSADRPLLNRAFPSALRRPLRWPQAVLPRGPLPHRPFALLHGLLADSAARRGRPVSVAPRGTRPTPDNGEWLS